MIRDEIGAVFLDPDVLEMGHKFDVVVATELGGRQGCFRAADDPRDEIAAFVAKGAPKPCGDGGILVIAFTGLGFGVRADDGYILRFVAAPLNGWSDVVDEGMLVNLITHLAECCVCMPKMNVTKRKTVMRRGRRGGTHVGN